MTTRRLPTYYLSHGGGPWPYMEDGGMRRRFDKLEASLLAIRREWDDAVRAVLVISGHWETAEFAVSSAARPGMVFDYYGFPEHLYRIKYDAPGSPELAIRVRAMLQAGGFACESDPERGFDHGTFSLMKPLYPNGEMPIVQLSVKQDLDPQAHLSVGRLLAPLRSEGVVIIGSGSSFHNLGLRGPAAIEPSRHFDDWLQQTLLQVSTAERRRRVATWMLAPHARSAHPREDHLIPLMVALGAAEEEPAALVYHQPDFLGGWALSSFRFGDPAPAIPYKRSRREPPKPTWEISNVRFRVGFSDPTRNLDIAGRGAHVQAGGLRRSGDCREAPYEIAEHCGMGVSIAQQAAAS